MKRLLTGALALILSVAAHATTLNPIQLLNPAGSTSGQAIVSTGASTAPAWSNVTATALVAQAANTVVANVTGSSASPTAVSMPSCNSTAAALGYANGTGFNCNTTINASLLNGATFSAPGAIGNVTASTGAFTALSATGNFTPSQTNGIIGTTTNNNANAGSVGEHVTATGTGISMATNTPTNITSISLTAGDWEVNGSCDFIPAGGTTMTSMIAGASSTSATLSAAPLNSVLQVPFTIGLAQVLPIPSQRFSLSTTTTIFLVAQSGFSGSTMTATGTIRARRVR